MRIIIVGAGPVGLTFAHTLQRAGITDFLVLERSSDVVEPSGAGLGLWGHNVRVFDQLGLLDEVRKLAPRMRRSVHLDPDGSVLSTSDLFYMIEKNHGHPFMMFERVRLMRLLNEKLPDAQKHIRTNAVVESLQDDGDEVVVTCADGTTYKGDIIVGADGVHSTVRRLMFPEEPLSPYTSTYRCLYGCGPRIDGMKASDMVESHNSDVLFQVLIGDDMAFWFLFERLPSTTRDWASYPDEEVERFAAKHGNIPINEGGHLRFRDVWESRKRAKLANIEEGIAKTWCKGRTVLLGDSCHKMTPNLAFGANNGIESGVVLVNLLHASLRENSGRPLTTQQIQDVFKAYQRERYNSAWWCMNLTGFYTRMAAWSNFLLQFAVKYVNPKLGDDGVADYLLGPIVRNGHVLEFAKEEAFTGGKMPWKYDKVDYVD